MDRIWDATMNGDVCMSEISLNAGTGQVWKKMGGRFDRCSKCHGPLCVPHEPPVAQNANGETRPTCTERELLFLFSCVFVLAGAILMWCGCTSEQHINAVRNITITLVGGVSWLTGVLFVLVVFVCP